MPNFTILKCLTSILSDFANGNAREIRCLYMKRYPNSMLPDHRILSNIRRRFVETGTLKTNSNDAGKPPQIEVGVLNEIEERLETSTRKISEHLNISHQSVWCILCFHQLYPFHISLSSRFSIKN